MIFKEIDNMKDVEAICHYLVINRICLENSFYDVNNHK
jgi:hypothetical protein